MGDGTHQWEEWDQPGHLRYNEQGYVPMGKVGCTGDCGVEPVGRMFPREEGDESGRPGVVPTRRSDQDETVGALEGHVRRRSGTNPKLWDVSVGREEEVRERKRLGGIERGGVWTTEIRLNNPFPPDVSGPELRTKKTNGRPITTVQQQEETRN